jgi:hypothetical protein
LPLDLTFSDVAMQGLVREHGESDSTLLHSIIYHIFLFLLKVCNLKEEVRSHQVHKLSEAHFQAFDDMLAVEKASKCDAAEESCQGKCHLEK